jgi:hypothetical protein
MHFAVAFPVSRGSDDDSVFSSINLVVAGERGGSAILARRFSLCRVRTETGYYIVRPVNLSRQLGLEAHRSAMTDPFVMAYGAGCIGL